MTALPAELETRIAALHAEGRAIFERFERDVRQHSFHPFKPADYTKIVAALLPFRDSCSTFLEWGSATGVIAITADLLGFDACGIEVDGALVDIARELAHRHGSAARFATGSLLPRDYVWRAADGDPRLGTLDEPGPPGYDELGRNLDDFDLVYGYPWTGEDGIMLDVMMRRGRIGAHLLLNGPDGIRVHEVTRAAP
jgi:hypothetical protein